MEAGIWGAVCSVLGSLLGAFVSWLALSRKQKKDSVEEGQSRGVMASDIGYIKAGVDDLKRENRETRCDVRELSEHVTRCEESTKQAHKRLDEVHHLIESK